MRQSVCKHSPLRNNHQNGDCSVGNYYIYTLSAARSAIKHVFRGTAPCYYCHPSAYRVESYCCSVCLVSVSCTHSHTFENILVPVPPGPHVIHLKNINVPAPAPESHTFEQYYGARAPGPACHTFEKHSWARAPGPRVIHLKNILGSVPPAGPVRHAFDKCYRACDHGPACVCPGTRVSYI